MRRPRCSTREYSDGLTAREAGVADLLREGMSNAAIAERLFISQLTVGFDVSAVLAKLGVTCYPELLAVPTGG